MSELKVNIVGVTTTNEEIIKNTSLDQFELGGGILLIFAIHKKVITKY